VQLKTDTTHKKPMDVMDRGVRNPEHKMEVVCPVLASLVKEASRILFEWYRAERGFLSHSKDISAIAARPWIV
jgi:hypothetical protein